MRIYSEWSHCFVCNAHILTKELELPEHLIDRAFKAEPTNIPNMIKYINSLPVATIRGLQLPYNERGYYVVWPNLDYYKLRLNSGNTRYIAPSGVKPPLFVYPGSARHLIIVEGEINCMTLHNCVFGEYKLCSPGPATDMMRHLKYYAQYQRITIIVDHDAPGVIFGCQLRDHLLTLKKRVNIIALDKDFNDILTSEGEEAVKCVFEREMGL